MAGGRHPLYAPSYDEDPGIMSEVETSATGFRTIRAPKTPRIASFPTLRQGRESAAPAPDRHTPWVSPVSPQLRHENLTLGLVFLQYRSETKRALLPNEITTLDTVKALFVRSFPKQLTMEYLDSPHIRVYIHDPAKDMFYELEDLRDIRDRSVLRIYEQEPNGEVYSTWEGAQLLLRTRIRLEYQNQHIHRAKGGVGYYGAAGLSAYCPLATQTLPPGPYSPPDRTKPPIAYAQTLPWGAHLTYAPSGPPSPERRPKEILIPPGVMQAPPKPQRSFQQGGTLPIGKGIRCTPPLPLGPAFHTLPRSGMPRPIVESRAPPFPRYAPERRHEPQGGYRPERPYSAGAQPIYTVSPERHYEPTYRKSFEGGYLSSPERRYEPAWPSRPSPLRRALLRGTERIYGTRSGSVTPVVDEEARLRVEHMERQLASLTGLVQKALTAPLRPSPQNQQIPTRDVTKERGQGEGFSEARSSKSSSCTSLADENSESQPEPHSKYAFKEEKSVSFSDETTTVSSPVHQKQHSPQHTVERPVKPAIKSSLSLRSQHSSDVDSVPTQLHPPMVKVTSADREPRSKPAPPLNRAPSPRDNTQLHPHQRKVPSERGDVQSAEASEEANQGSEAGGAESEEDCAVAGHHGQRNCQGDLSQNKDHAGGCTNGGRTRLCRKVEGVEGRRVIPTRCQPFGKEDLLEPGGRSEGSVINRKCRVNLGDVEGMALVLSRASKAVAELKARFPALQESLKTIMAVEMEVVVREEKFLKDEPERLENALRRCKKLTGTLVTLKRLASVQEQRHTVGHHLPEKSHSADGPHSDGEMHSTKSSRQGLEEEF
ncbi:coiled-coil domain-containing protein AGAP005037 [Caerostris extrusa]|uniref:Coiled-coil domain-containing protein AGAP005037 n=1 Tax=Caerostris extrusa TaxID=172846 RepID=A0AAV4QN15_CAEEX|nr:coiled-coil domain-containing protein AGAP005037 [Caerostris extrusa]